jgi:hypothetical protein
VTDDIVTRLRLWASVTDGDHVIEELHRAADEIERLRKIINRWETCKMVYDDLCEPDELCKACKEVAGG